MTDLEMAVLSEIENGLPISPEPYAEIAARLEVKEGDVIATLRHLQANGVISRFGVVVRHRELGYLANAMVVWDVPDDLVSETGRRLATRSEVTLCYRRPRRLPIWPYNLFCMIHGKDRETVEGTIDRLIEEAGVGGYPHAVLFSGKRFKQRGARYGRGSRRAA